MPPFIEIYAHEYLNNRNWLMSFWGPWANPSSDGQFFLINKNPLFKSSEDIFSAHNRAVAMKLT